MSPPSPVKLEAATEALFEGPFDLVVLDIPLTSALTREVIGQLGSAETEGEVGGPPGVSIPVARFVRPLHRRGLTNGTHATLAVSAGATSHLVAAALGCESFTTTARHYAKTEAVEGALQERVLEKFTVVHGHPNVPP